MKSLLFPLTLLLFLAAFAPNRLSAGETPETGAKPSFQAGAAHVTVWADEEGVFHAQRRDGSIIFSDTEMLDVIQHAVNSLTEGRREKEMVQVVSSGVVYRRLERDGSGARALRVPSYTILDIPATIRVEREEPEPEGVRTDRRVLINARNASHIEFPNMNFEGEFAWGMKLESVSHVRIGHLRTVGGGSPIRIDNEGTGNARSTDIVIDSAYIEGSSHHAVETRGVDRLQIGRVFAQHIDGCGVLLNNTNDVTIESILGHNPEATSRYATFRVTQNDHGRITVGQVVSVDAPRGIHIHGGTGEMVISNIYIDGARSGGIRLSSSPNTILSNGVIKNVNGPAINVYTWDDEAEADRIADGVSISNFRIYDDRPEGERRQTRGIVFRGINGRIVNNDLRNAGTQANLELHSPSTLVANNTGAGVAQGTVNLRSGNNPAARVEGVSPHRNVSLALRATPRDAPSASFAWGHYFEYNGETEQWDLVIGWHTDPGEDMELDYIVDQPVANLGL